MRKYSSELYDEAGVDKGQYLSCVQMLALIAYPRPILLEEDRDLDHAIKESFLYPISEQLYRMR